MPLASAKTILTTYNILGNQQEAKRRPKNEFQAYAYKLAHDLNDLQHLKIYMRLAKSVERSLMERAYSFVIDSRTSDKGKLFLWKLRKLREQLDRERNKSNFKTDYVFKKIKDFRNKFAKNLIEKNDQEISTDLVQILFSQVENIQGRFKRILLIGNTSKKIKRYFDNSGFYIYALDSSKEIHKIVSAKDVKCKAVDLLASNYKKDYFDLIIINNYWQLVPQDDELKCLKKLKPILKEHGKILLMSRKFTKTSQEWKEMEHGKEIITYFIKTSLKKDITESFEKIGFNLQEYYPSENQQYYVFGL